MRTLASNGHREVVALECAGGYFTPAQALQKFMARFTVIGDAAELQDRINCFDADWRRDGWLGMGQLVRLALSQRRCPATPA